MVAYAYLFDKHDRLCLEILERLNTNRHHNLLHKALAEEMHLTPYQVNTTLDYMNMILANMGDAKIEKRDDGSWQAIGLNGNVLKRMTVQLLEQSVAFNAFNYYHFFDQRETITSFIERRYIVHGTFARATRALRQRWGHNMGHAGNYYDEAAIRLYLLQLYYDEYHGICDPFPEIAEQTTAITDCVQKFIDGPLLPTQLTRLNIFTGVWLLRQQNRGIMTSKVYPTLTMAPFDKLRSALRRLGANVNEAELNYYCNFLIAQKYIPCPQSATDVVLPVAGLLTKEFMQLVRATDAISLSPASTKLLDHRLTQIHRQLTSFMPAAAKRDNEELRQFFTQLYPVFNNLANTFIEQIDHHPEIILTNSARINLYFSYVTALIDASQADTNTRPVNICVDFSEDARFNQYVLTVMNTFGGNVIRVEHVLRPETDIYIFDFKAPDLKMTQVIWPNTPKPHDWVELAREIRNCQNTSADIVTTQNNRTA